MNPGQPLRAALWPLRFISIEAMSGIVLLAGAAFARWHPLHVPRPKAAAALVLARQGILAEAWYWTVGDHARVYSPLSALFWQRAAMTMRAARAADIQRRWLLRITSGAGLAGLLALGVGLNLRRRGSRRTKNSNAAACRYGARS